MPAAAIRVDRLSKRFGAAQAVRDISFEIAPGELVGFLGPNGAGKSTTMRMLAGFLSPSAGSASIGGRDSVNDSLALRASLGYLPENNPLYPEMRVASYLGFRARLQRVERRRRGAAVDRAIERCALADVRRRRIGELSKGYRQRVGLAAAILHDPPALILDEPTGGLDPSQIVQTRALLRGLAGEHTILLSTHVLPEVERTCSRVIVIARGRIRADGSPEAVAASGAAGGVRRVIVEVERRAGGADVAALLRGVAGAARVTQSAASEGWERWVVESAPSADVRAGVARACAGAGLLARELRFEGDGSLEAAFARLIEEPDDAPGPAR